MRNYYFIISVLTGNFVYVCVCVRVRHLRGDHPVRCFIHAHVWRPRALAATKVKRFVQIDVRALAPHAPA